MKACTEMCYHDGGCCSMSRLQQRNVLSYEVAPWGDAALCHISECACTIC